VRFLGVALCGFLCGVVRWLIGCIVARWLRGYVATWRDCAAVDDVLFLGVCNGVCE